MFKFFTDRYKYLPSPDHRLKFLGMQLELLEDFRIRLVQVMKEVTHDSLGDTFCAIFNAVHYITEVLREWCNATVGQHVLSRLYWNIVKLKFIFELRFAFIKIILWSSCKTIFCTCCLSYPWDLTIVLMLQFFVELQYHSAARPVEFAADPGKRDAKVNKRVDLTIIP